MAALPDEVQVELAQRGHEAVRIADDVAVAVGQQTARSGASVGGGRRRSARRGRPGATLRSVRRSTPSVRDERHLGGAGMAEADEPAAVGLFVGTQQPVGIGVGAGEEGGELRVQRRHASG